MYQGTSWTASTGTKGRQTVGEPSDRNGTFSTIQQTASKARPQLPQHDESKTQAQCAPDRPGRVAS
jgi:hypothetical protein